MAAYHRLLGNERYLADPPRREPGEYWRSDIDAARNTAFGKRLKAGKGPRNGNRRAAGSDRGFAVSNCILAFRPKRCSFRNLRIFRSRGAAAPIFSSENRGPTSIGNGPIRSTRTAIRPNRTPNSSGGARCLRGKWSNANLNWHSSLRTGNSLSACFGVP